MKIKTPPVWGLTKFPSNEHPEREGVHQERMREDLDDRPADDNTLVDLEVATGFRTTTRQTALRCPKKVLVLKRVLSTT